MKSIIVSLFALGLLAGTATTASALTISIGDHHGHHRHCTDWGWRHHHHDRWCRHWGW